MKLHWEETVGQCDSRVINKKGVGGTSRERTDALYQEGFQSAVLSKWRNESLRKVTVKKGKEK